MIFCFGFSHSPPHPWETSWSRQTPASRSWRNIKKQAYFGLPFQQEHSYIGKLWPQLTLASFCWDMKQRSLLDPSWKEDPAETCLTPKKRVKIRFQLFNQWTHIQCMTLQARTTPGKQRDTRGRGREWKILTLYHKHFHHNIYLNSKT